MKRIIACMDILNGMVAKCVNYREPKILGEATLFAEKYYEDGADELTLLDISASSERREGNIELLKRVSRDIFVPITFGGGIRTKEDIAKILASGADKVAICTAAVNDPELITTASKRFGSQAIVISVDAKKERDKWTVYIYGGKKRSGIDALEYAKECEMLGAGELLINSLDRDGTNSGYDLQLLSMISTSVGIPVIASSGAGKLSDVSDAFTIGKVDAALLAGMLHYNKYTLKEVKEYLRIKGLCVRETV